MGKIKINGGFQGITPLIEPKLLKGNRAQTANNLKLRSGRLENLKDKASETTVASGRNSIFLFNSDETPEWLSWAEDVDVVQAPIADDQYDRIVYTGASDGKLKLYGSGAYGTKDAEVPKPSVVSINSYASKFASLASSATAKKAIGTLNPIYYGADDVLSPPSVTDGLVPLTYISSAKQEDGYLVKFRFPGAWYKGTLPAYIGYTDTYQISFGSIDFPESFPTFKAEDGEPVQFEDEYGVYAEGYVEEITTDNEDTTFAPQYPVGDSVTLTVNPHDVYFKIKLVPSSYSNNFYYVRRLVLEDGREGSPSDVSEVAVAGASDNVVLSFTSLAGETEADKQRLYRSASGTKESAFLFLAELNASATSYTDKIPDKYLQEPMPAWGTPQDNMKGVVSMAGGFIVAFKGKDIYFSEPFLPHVFPSKYRITVDEEIVGLASSHNDLLVVTEGQPYLISGYHPAVATQMKLPYRQSGASKGSICSAVGNMFYASPDGLVMVKGMQQELVTKNVFSRAQWQALSPSSMICEELDNKLYLFTDTKTYLFDFSGYGMEVTTLEETADAVHRDIFNDALYILSGTTIYELHGSATNLRLTWRSKTFRAKRPVTWSCIRVVSDSYPVTDGDECVIYLYANDSLVLTSTVTANQAFRIPVLRPEFEWYFEVKSNYPIDEVCLATSMGDL